MPALFCSSSERLTGDVPDEMDGMDGIVCFSFGSYSMPESEIQPFVWLFNNKSVDAIGSPAQELAYYCWNDI